MNNTLVLFDPNNALEETEKEIDKQFIVEGNPKTRLWKCFISEDKKIHSGFWTCQGGAFVIPTHTSNEMCTVLEGEAIVETEDGKQFHIKAGDTIFIPYGIKNTWYVKDFIRKSYICSFPQ